MDAARSAWNPAYPAGSFAGTDFYSRSEHGAEPLDFPLPSAPERRRERRELRTPL